MNPFIYLAQDIELNVEQGWEDFYCVNCDSDHPLEATKEDLAMYTNSVAKVLSVLC